MTRRPLVVVTNRVHAETLEALGERCEVSANQTGEPLGREQLLARARDAEGAMVFMPDRLDAEALDACPRLQVVAGALKGTDNFDVEACTERGIWFTVVPDLLSAPTAELAVGLVLGLLRRIPEGDARVRGGGFAGWRPELYGGSLEGATAGIVGLGAVGRELAPRLVAFGARVVFNDPAVAGSIALEELLAASDVVLPLPPLTEATHHLIDRRALELMRPGAVLVNVGRGSVVDERAVAEALAAGRLGGYAADVFELEDWARADRPRAVDPRLLVHPRTLFTPHLGSAVAGVRRRIELEAAANLLAALDGRRPPGAVNDVPAGLVRH